MLQIYENRLVMAGIVLELQVLSKNTFVPWSKYPYLLLATISYSSFQIQKTKMKTLVNSSVLF